MTTCAAPTAAAAAVERDHRLTPCQHSARGEPVACWLNASGWWVCAVCHPNPAGVGVHVLARGCPRCGRLANHYGGDPQAGWVCGHCYPAADQCLRGGASTDQSLQAEPLLRGEQDSRAEGTRHGWFPPAWKSRTLASLGS